MAALEWDKTGERELESGVSKVVLYPMTNGAYDTGVAWSGVTAISENPGGADITDLYADNIKYASLRAAETFGFTIEAYMYPDEWAACDGSASVTGAAGVLVGQQTRKAFGLAYRTEIGDDAHPGMDKGYKLHLVYNSTASPSGRSYSTINNSPDAITFSWEGNSTPVNVNVAGLKPTCLITIDSTTADSTKLAALEAMLYGGESSGATLPNPATVLSTLGYTAPAGG